MAAKGSSTKDVLVPLAIVLGKMILEEAYEWYKESKQGGDQENQRHQGQKKKEETRTEKKIQRLNNQKGEGNMLQLNSIKFESATKGTKSKWIFEFRIPGLRCSHYS